ncbi:Xaa-Pro aminopeptidase [Ferrimonas lipolytica]|uniref:Xaa-Pro aminopeptidase n=1 Tax=Ferrimonas lipolytica TaxID=2724191 RepID=A0A6H1UEY6_9GAMM|nr:Xaa-Pro aminopeptidase [Ferrimonas lipolytica]QIZ77667.1 Xaa-Pro aminopeptidase [Ferrimonas lipolytica]
MDQALAASHRQQLLAQMPENSVALVYGSAEVTRSNDTEYRFRQDSDLFYLTGFNEPDALLLLRKGQTPESVIFVRPRDEMMEIWHGRRLGAERAPDALGVDAAYSIDDLAKELPLLVSGFDVLLHRNGFSSREDEAVASLLATLRVGQRQGLKALTQVQDLRTILHELRLHKSDAELELMATAARLSAEGHTRAMQVCKPGMFEYQLEAEIKHHCAMNGALEMAYGTIVGGGENACILHYTENECELKSGDLVLIDAGAEYRGYAGDITRTFPVNGKFSDEQKALYTLVLNAEKAAISMLKPGVAIKQANAKVLEIMVGGLVELGIMQGEVAELIETEAYKKFYMHGLGHWLGLDVHDVGDYYSADRTRPLEQGMVLTIEPGLYIAPDADVDPKWQGIGVRIEDNIAITADGHINMTASVVKEIADIEALMAG